MDCTADSHHSHVCLLNSISYCPAAQTRKACLVFPNECNTSEQVIGEFDDSGSLKKKKTEMVLPAPTPSPLRATVFFTALMGFGPGSTCELEAYMGLFHVVERALLLTATNLDQLTCSKTMASVRAEHFSIAHLCVSFR